MSSIFHLVYISEASRDISYSDLRDILEVSRTNNIRDGITGLLVYRDGYFLQLLEGDEKTIKNLVNKIRFDVRNSSLRVLIETSGEERLFGDWSMAFYDGDISASATEHIVTLFESCAAVDSEQRFLIMPMLKKFRAAAPELK
jgi:hypothetical protein